MLRLVVTINNQEHSFALPESEAKLGSASSNDLVLRAVGVSRVHAKLRRRLRGVEISDLGSKNGLLVEGQRVDRVVLTPGLRVQIGGAWLELEEVSTGERAFASVLGRSGSRDGPRPTKTADPLEVVGTTSSAEAALTLAYHIDQVGVGVPGKRDDLLLRIRAVLGAEVFAAFERTPLGNLRLREGAGSLSPGDRKLLASLVSSGKVTVHEQVIVRRIETLLVAGRDSWLLVAKFDEERMAREPWRKDFLRFLLSQFFVPIRRLWDVETLEAVRVFRLTRNNARRTAELLAVSPGKLYALLKRVGLPKRRMR